MSVEHLNSSNQGERQRIKFSRREFFKKATKVAAASGAAVFALSVVGNEIVKGKDGLIKTREGIYYPIYEAHNIGISPKDIPQNIDALFLEGFSEGVIREETLDRIAKRQIPLVFGDVGRDVGGLPSYSIIAAEAGIGALAFLADQFLLKRRDKREENKEEVHGFKRRELIKLGLKAASLYLSLPLLSKSTVTSVLLQNKDSIPNSITRTVRLHGIVSDIHPEDTIIFLRNAIMANNLLNTGDYLKEKLGRRPKIAYLVGGSHSGIEDFLQAGKSVCRDVILAYPARYLRSIVENAGDIDYLCSSRLIKLNPQDRYETVESTKILDNNLKQKLLAKL